MIGKSLAIVSDARLSGRPDQAAIVERLLSISGEDSITVDRKNMRPITCRLSTRIEQIADHRGPRGPEWGPSWLHSEPQHEPKSSPEGVSDPVANPPQLTVPDPVESDPWTDAFDPN